MIFVLNGELKTLHLICVIWFCDLNSRLFRMIIPVTCDNLRWKASTDLLVPAIQTNMYSILQSVFYICNETERQSTSVENDTARLGIPIHSGTSLRQTKLKNRCPVLPARSWQKRAAWIIIMDCDPSPNNPPFLLGGKDRIHRSNRPDTEKAMAEGCGRWATRQLRISCASSLRCWLDRLSPASSLMSATCDCQYPNSEENS